MRIATYNIHKCRGMDGRVRPERIGQVLQRINADVIALQEVLSVPGKEPQCDQARFLAEVLRMHFIFGENRKLRGGIYGNVVLSRYPLQMAGNCDLSVPGREERGCLRVDVEAGNGRMLHIFNVHLGTALRERRHQGAKLISDQMLHRDLRGPRIVLGDFNEWTRGITTRLLSEHLVSADLRMHLRRTRTYPGILPFMHLDHIYYDKALEMERMSWVRTPLALVASDHLPLVAEFR